MVELASVLGAGLALLLAVAGGWLAGVSAGAVLALGDGTDGVDETVSVVVVSALAVAGIELVVEAVVLGVASTLGELMPLVLEPIEPCACASMPALVLDELETGSRAERLDAVLLALLFFAVALLSVLFDEDFAGVVFSGAAIEVVEPLLLGACGAAAVVSAWAVVVVGVSLAVGAGVVGCVRFASATTAGRAEAVEVLSVSLTW